MKATCYKLDEYKIIETDNGTLWWEAHAGLSSVKRGRCFLRGEVLLIGPSESEDTGFLKREFLDRVQRLPQWKKTKNYCSNYTLYHCRSGRKLSTKEISEWEGNRTHSTKYADHPQGPFRNPTSKEGQVSEEEVSYKLGRYEIIKKANGEMGWKTFSRLGNLREGSCLIAGDILYMGGVETEEPGDLKHAFLERLNRLPEWGSTKFYCPACTIYDCRTGKNQFGEERGGLPGKAPGNSAEGIFAAPATSTASYRPSPKVRRPPLIDSSLALLKEMTAKAGKRGKRKPQGTGPKYKSGNKTESIRSDLTTPKAPGHVYHIKRWIIILAALILIIGTLLSVLLGGFWEDRDNHHKNHGHSSRHHRDH